MFKISGKFIFLTFIFLVIGLPVFAEKPKELVEFLESVKNNHPAILATDFEIKEAQAKLLYEKGNFDSTLKGGYSSYPKGDYSGTYGSIFVEKPLEFMGSKIIAGYRRGGGSFPVYEDYNYTNDQGEASLGFEIPLLRDRETDRRRLAIGIAFRDVNIANLTQQQKVINVLNAAEISYWNWIGAKRRNLAFKKLLDNAVVRKKQISTRVSKGETAALDKIDNDRQIAQRQALLLLSQRELDKSNNYISLFLWGEKNNIENFKGFSVPKENQVPLIAKLNNIDHLTEIALSNRAEHREIAEKIEQKNLELKYAENQTLPSLVVGAYGSKDYGEGSSTRDETEIKSMLRLEIPIEQNRQEGLKGQVKNKLSKLYLDKKYIEQQIEVEVKDRINALNLALQRYAYLKDEIKASELLEEGEKVKFEHGDSNLFFVNVREQNTIDSIVSSIEAQVNIWRTYIDLKNILGVQTID